MKSGLLPAAAPVPADPASFSTQASGAGLVQVIVVPEPVPVPAGGWGVVVRPLRPLAISGSGSASFSTSARGVGVVEDLARKRRIAAQNLMLILQDLEDDDDAAMVGLRVSVLVGVDDEDAA